ncbi:hypothetical protein RGUI_0133 [Rhodovulum sp. P5]|nr:hypothetical protein RGUI_0133 [Rhodovulum sp. P5]
MLATPLTAGGHGATAHATGGHGDDHAAASNGHAKPASHDISLERPSQSNDDICTGFGPQAPRDIGMPLGTNTRHFTMAPPARKMNLCNIHTHTNAEHAGPGFMIYAGSGEHGGYKCNESDSLSAEDLMDPPHQEGAFEAVAPGDTLEVHWVYTTCDVKPGAGLGSCLSPTCSNPQLRVESQVFLLVNDPHALNFMDFAYQGNMANGLHQPKSLPTGTGRPVVFAGSTTGTKYTAKKCSPMQVTWSVRTGCARLDIGSVYKWGASHNVFEEHHSHGVRQLVTALELLSPITP